jgi:hypothetical protein
MFFKLKILRIILLSFKFFFNSKYYIIKNQIIFLIKTKIKLNILIFEFVY